MIVKNIDVQVNVVCLPLLDDPLDARRITEVTGSMDRQVTILIDSLEYLVYHALVEGLLIDSVYDFWLLVSETLADRAHEGELMHLNRCLLLLAALLATLGEAYTECCLETDAENCTHLFLLF